MRRFAGSPTHKCHPREGGDPAKGSRMKLFLLLGIIVCIPIAWFILKIFLALVVPTEESGQLFLKQQLKNLGIETNKIPAPFYEEVVKNQIKYAKMLQQCSGNSTPQYKNWRANLVRQLEIEAATISYLISENKRTEKNTEIYATLIKHGILKE